MTRVAYENKLKVYFANSNGVADITAPTEAEIGAATYLGHFLQRDAISFGMSQSRVDVSSIDDNWDLEVMGTVAMQPSLMLYRDDDNEAAGYDLVENGTDGFLIFSTFGEPESGDTVFVAPVQMGEPIWQDTAANTAQRILVNFALRDTPAPKATVAAS